MDVFDLLLAPFYLILVFIIAYKYKAKHEHKNVAYKYFLPGLVAKIVGAICLGLVYTFYYSGGDTFNYFNTSCAFVDSFLSHPNDFFHLYFGNPSASEYYLLKTDENFVYWINDPYAYFVSKCFFPFVFLGCKSYMATSIIVASLCYVGVWRLYLVFISEFPNLYIEFSYCILFVPSVIFWGSGIMKDSITFSSVCLYVYGFYGFLIQKKYKLSFALSMLFSSYLLISIKPYIFFALLPGSVVWFVATKVSNIKNGLVKIMIAPTIIALGGLLTFNLITNLGGALGKYSIDRVFETAQGAQQDLKRSEYQGNSFDIGNYEPTPLGLLSVSHKAIFAALFRPTILDVKNIVMLISAIENTFMLLFCIYILLRLKVYKFFTLMSLHPLATFSFIFALFFALSVGVSISNFGTLVRLKIPCIPFFIASLVILNDFVRKKQVD